MSAQQAAGFGPITAAKFGGSQYMVHKNAPSACHNA